MLQFSSGTRGDWVVNRSIIRGFWALMLSAFLCTPAAARDWLRADTHNFIIYSDGSSRQLQEFALNVERFDALLRQRFGVELDPDPYRLTIYMVSSSRKVSQLVGDKSGFVAGFYRPSSEGSFALSNRERGSSKYDLSGEITLFHEYAHHFMFRNFTFAYPAWFREGFAEYYSTVTFDGNDGWTYGKPAMHRAPGLFLGKRLPVADVLSRDVSDFRGDQRELFYGQSWALVHMLQANAERYEQLADYLRKAGAGGDPRVAAEQAFGDLGKLDKELNDYLRDPLTYRRSTVGVTIAGVIEVKELSPLESRVAELKMMRLAQHDLAEARDELRSLAQSAPGEASAWLELALAERDLANAEDRDDMAAAEAAVDRALAADPDHIRANVLKAQLMMGRLGEEDDASKEDWAAVRHHIQLANRQDPEDPMPLLAFVESYYREGRAPPPIALDALGKAHSLVPEASDVRVNYAFALANADRYDEAIELVEFLAADPHSGEFGKHVLGQIRAMRSGTVYVPMEELQVAEGEAGD